MTVGDSQGCPSGSGTLFRTHLLLYKSGITNAGLGVYAINEMRSATPERPIQEDALCWCYQDILPKPRLNTCIVAAYTGARYESHDSIVHSEDDRIEVITEPDGRKVNPNEGGGIAAYFNQAHGTAALMLLWPGDKSSCFHHLGDFAGFSHLVVIKDIKPGEELFWDYAAITDDPDDILLKVPCHCNGKRWRRKVFGDVFNGRGCKKSLITFQKSICGKKK